MNYPYYWNLISAVCFVICAVLTFISAKTAKDPSTKKTYTGLCIIHVATTLAHLALAFIKIYLPLA